jgi:hypothetical protein
VVTRFRRGALVPIVLSAAVLAAAGCGKDELAQKFTGGTSSRDKQPIQSTVQAGQQTPAQPQPAGTVAPSIVSDPVAATKMETQLVDGKPIREQSQKYRATNKRDPFRSLIQDTDERSDLVDLSVVSLVGIVQGDVPFCIVEDAEGIAYVLRKGDRVKNGRVVSIGTDTVVASQTLLGYTTTVRLKMEEERGSHG